MRIVAGKGNDPLSRRRLLASCCPFTPNVRDNPLRQSLTDLPVPTTEMVATAIGRRSELIRQSPVMKQSPEIDPSRWCGILIVLETSSLIHRIPQSISL